MNRRQGLVSINIFDLIDSICTEFRQQSKSGKRPKIEDHLEQVPPNARENLFRNLLQLDVRYRHQAGEQPVSDDYLGRFPDFQRLIRQAFDEPTLVSMEALHGTSVDVLNSATVDLETPGRL